ncbi:hypothetical protein [Trinickia sp. EG282A]|uniref:hypothetical protein n=1 Tax=Trinickia sp. EG282A TaxID=3237013 RepID=UPI0034D33448
MKNKILVACVLVGASTLASAASTADNFNSKLYQSCNDRSRVAVSAAMVTAKGQSTDSFVNGYKGSSLDKRLAAMALNALHADFREADSQSMVVLQNFLAGVCYQSSRT